MSRFLPNFEFSLHVVGFRSFQFHDVFTLDNENRAEDTPTLIDRKVCFVFLLETLCWVGVDTYFQKLTICDLHIIFFSGQCVYHIKSQIKISSFTVGFKVSLLIFCLIIRSLYIVKTSLFFWQVDYRSGSSDCLCDLWWHCLCLCWTTGLNIIAALSYVHDVLNVEQKVLI